MNGGQGVNPFLAIIIKNWVKGNLHYIGICQTLQQCFIIQKIIITKQIQNKQIANILWLPISQLVMVQAKIVWLKVK